MGLLGPLSKNRPGASKGGGERQGEGHATVCRVCQKKAGKICMQSAVHLSSLHISQLRTLIDWVSGGRSPRQCRKRVGGHDSLSQ